MTMRRFQIRRTADVTGMSGTGIVAEGVRYSDGRASVHWPGTHPSTVAWDRIEDALHVHGHAGNTQIVWLDDADQAVADLDPATVWVIPKLPAEPGWLTGNGRVWAMSAPEDVMRPGEVRQFAAKYLAAADEAERQNGVTR